LVAGIFSELAGIYASQGDYKKSVECYKRELPERGSDSAALCKADLSTTSPLVKEKSLFTSADDIQQPLRR